MNRLVLFILILGLAVATNDEQCRIDINERYNCLPYENNLWNKKAECLRLHCCWVKKSGSDESPSCYYPADYGYNVESIETNENGFVGILNRNTQYPNPFPDPVEQARVEVVSETDTRLHIKIVDNQSERYEVPIELASSKSNMNDASYEVTYTNKPFNFKISRKSSSTPLFDTTYGGITFADQFLQISTSLPSSTILGLGEHQGIPLSLDLHNHRVVNWPHDSPTPRGYMNLYGHHPFYMCIEQDGKAHGVLFYNSNAIEFGLQSNPSLTFRSIGGIFDIYIFTGPTPDEVIQQYTALVGRPFLIPDWALGFQLCRWGFNSLVNFEAAYNRMKDNHFPVDVMWTDIDVMNNNQIFTYNNRTFKGLPEFIERLHRDNVKYVSMADPAYPSGHPVDDAATVMDVSVKHADGVHNARGSQWRYNESFIDVYHPNASLFINTMLTKWFQETPLDAVWVDMNEPALCWDHLKNCTTSKYNNPPFMPAVRNGHIEDKTICLDSVFYGNKLHYNVHSTYGYLHSKLVYQEYAKIMKKRSFVISRSTFVGSGQYTGHWGGDNWSTWTDMKSSIWTVTMFNMYGIPYIGVDICGFVGIPTTELCTRWMQLGAFYTFTRNHNFMYMPNQDPGSYDAITIQRMKNMMNIRYSLFPYLYTLMFNSHLTGSPVIKPLMFNYPEDKNTYAIDTQMMWSNSLLISPVLERKVKELSLYLPKGIWYDWYTNDSINSEGQFITVPVTMDNIPLHVRGGSIYFLQEPKETITQTRYTNYKLHIYLDNQEEAQGYMFIDEGDNLDVISGDKYTHVLYSVSNNQFISTIQEHGYEITPVLDTIIIRGIKDTVESVVVNNDQVNFKYENSILSVENISVNMNENINIQWNKTKNINEIETDTSIEIEVPEN